MKQQQKLAEIPNVRDERKDVSYGWNVQEKGRNDELEKISNN